MFFQSFSHDILPRAYFGIQNDKLHFLNVFLNLIGSLGHHQNLTHFWHHGTRHTSGVARIFCGEVLFTNKRNFFVGVKNEYRMVLSGLAYRLVKLDILTSFIE